MSNNKISILFIDDEKHNLDSLRATYRREWEVFVAENAEQGNRIMQDNPINVVMSDYKMPVKNGVDLLEEYANKYPHVSRILITAHADTPLVSQAVNKGKIHYFLEKPWNNETLRQAVNSCFKINQMNLEITEKNQLLARAYDDLSRFIYSASHEMRSPLMSILGLIDLIKEENTSHNEQIEEYLTHMSESVSNIDQYIKGIIQYYNNSKIESTPSQIDFEELLFEIKKEMGIHLDERIFTTVNYEEGEESFVCDPFKMKIILSNLIQSLINAQNKSYVKPEILNIFIRVSSVEVIIEINEGQSDVVFGLIENVFKFFFTSNTKQTQTVKEYDVMNLFLLKDTLLKVNGYIDFNKNNDSLTYRIVIPSAK